MEHKRVIIHIDIDCFYAQVEEILDPSLKDKPVGVSQKNIVVTCNYIARDLGIKKLMYIKDAIKICSEMVLCNGEDLLKYRNMSTEIHAVIQNYSDKVEKLGMDENFVDVTHLIDGYRKKLSDYNQNVMKLVGHHMASDEEVERCRCGCRERLIIGSIIANDIRNSLFSELGITSCAGISYNKTLAKLVGSSHKPNQQTTLFPSGVLSFMKSMGDVRSIPGIGSVMSKKLKQIGLETVEQLQNVSRFYLLSKLNALDTSSSNTSSAVDELCDLSRGIDRKEVKMSTRSKSIGAEDGFPSILATNLDSMLVKMKLLLNRVWMLVMLDGRIPKTIKLTVRKYSSDYSHNDSSAGQQSIREQRQLILPCHLVDSFKNLTTTVNIENRSENYRQQQQERATRLRELDEMQTKKVLDICIQLYHSCLQVHDNASMHDAASMTAFTTSTMKTNAVVASRGICWKVTLLGMSFSNFIENDVTVGGISRFFGNSSTASSSSAMAAVCNKESINNKKRKIDSTVSKSSSSTSSSSSPLFINASSSSSSTSVANSAKPMTICIDADNNESDDDGDADVVELPIRPIGTQESMVCAFDNSTSDEKTKSICTSRNHLKIMNIHPNSTTQNLIENYLSANHTVDREVFKALPEFLQLEIIRNSSITNSNNQKQNSK